LYWNEGLAREQLDGQADQIVSHQFIGDSRFDPDHSLLHDCTGGQKGSNYFKSSAEMITSFGD
jgi:hypothetical protein